MVNNSPRREVPVDLRRDFIHLVQRIRNKNPELNEDTIWSYAYDIQHAIVEADWFMFKQNIGLK